MPWSKKTVATAQAVAHGWEPKGKARGFSKKFAEQVIAEGTKGENMAGLIDRGSYKKGGKVKETGKALLHKGEVVLTAKQAKKAKKAGFDWNAGT
jgi:ribosomal protein L18